MAKPRLTGLFDKEADRAFTREISAEIWQRVGEELGFSEMEIEEALPTATQSADSSPPAQTPPKKGNTFRVVFGTGLAMIGVAAAVAICTPLLRGGGPTVTISENPLPLSSFAGPRVECLAEVSYPVGSSVPLEIFLRDAQIRAYEADGTDGEFTVKGFEEIDFETPGEYPVHVETGSHDQTVVRVIIVIIE